MAINIINLVRGDTFSFRLNVDDNSSEDGLYRLTDYDALYLGVTLPHQPFEHAIIKKKYTKADQLKDGNIIAKFISEDTIDLLPGVYYYSVKLRQNIGTDYESVTTVINKTKLVLND